METISKIVTWCISIVCFLAGGLIYLMFREEHLLMFDWFRAIGLSDFVLQLKNYGRSFGSIPDWIRFSLPDGLWVLSYVLAMSALWNFDIKSHWGKIGVIPVIAIISEYLQYFGVIGGGFDTRDLTFYCIATIIGFIYTILIKSYEKKHY